MEALKSGMLFRLLIPGSKGGPDAVVLIALDAGADKFQTHDAVLNGGIGVGRGKGSGFFGSQMLAEGAVEVAERLEVPLRMSRRQTTEAVGFDAVAFAVGRQNLSGFVQTGEFQRRPPPQPDARKACSAEFHRAAQGESGFLRTLGGCGSGAGKSPSHPFGQNGLMVFPRLAGNAWGCKRNALCIPGLLQTAG